MFSSTSNSQTSQYSNVALPNENNSSSRQPVNNGRDTEAQISIQSIDVPGRTQIDMSNGILIEQLDGIEDAIEAMQVPATGDEESLSLLLSATDNEDFLQNVFGNMSWNFM